MANEAEQAIYTRLASAPTFHPVTADLFVNDWGLDAGDVITVRSGETDYSVPIYNMSLDWRGSAMAQIQSTGNKERKPLSALKRKEFRSGRSGYTTQKEIDHYETDFIRDRKNIGMFARAIGVQLDENGDPIIDPETGDYVWDDENGAEIYSRLILSPNRAELVSAINDGAGNKISGAKIDVSAQGAVLIEAINNRPSSQSSVVIRADRVNLEGLVTASQLDTRLANIDTLFTRTGYSGTIYTDSIHAGGLWGSTLHLASGEENYTNYSAKVFFIGNQQQDLSFLGNGNIASFTVPNAITNLQIVAPGSGSNTYTLQGKSFDSPANWFDIGTFSRATSLSGRWSGRNYIVTAAPQGEINTGIVYDGLVPTGQVTKSGQYVYQDFIVYSDDGEGDADQVIMQKSVGINASSVYNDGWSHCISSEITVSAPDSATLNYDEIVYLTVTARNPNGTNTSILSRTYVAPSQGGGGSYAQGWNALVEAATTSTYVQYSGASSVSSSLTKSNGTIDGYIWLKDYSGTWQRRRHLTVSYPNDTYNKSVTLTYKGSVSGVYTYTTSTYVSGLSTGSRYTVHFNA